MPRPLKLSFVFKMLNRWQLLSTFTQKITEAPKGLTAKHMDYGSRNMDFGFWIQYYQNQKIPKNKID
jgi:hypothetical protein